jgi:hypothetical protein
MVEESKEAAVLQKYLFRYGKPQVILSARRLSNMQQRYVEE